MPSLKDLRNRISSVKSTKKITSAMKMVAAAKLKRAQENAEKTRPYAEKMKNIVESLTENVNKSSFKYGKKNDNNSNVLLIVCSADRGLCGGFNGSIIRFTKNTCENLKNDGKTPKFLFVGKKAYNSLKKKFEASILDSFIDYANPSIKFELSAEIRDRAMTLFTNNEIDECYLIFTKFKSAISQTVIKQKLLPVEILPEEKDSTNNDYDSSKSAAYEYEPSEEVILDEIIPRNIAIQIHSGLLENLASEQGSRMTAMDNATRNANDMIDDLTLYYNRSRQAVITKELIEIISGAEAI